MSNAYNKLREFLAEKAEVLSFARASISYSFNLRANSAAAHSRRLDFLIKTQKPEAAVEYVEREEFDVNRPVGALKSTPLMFAALKGNLPLVKALLKEGADPLAKDKRGMTARAYATTLDVAGGPAFEICRLLRAAERTAEKREKKIMAGLVRNMCEGLRAREPLKRPSYFFFMTELYGDLYWSELGRFLEKGDRLKQLETAVKAEFPWIDHLRIGSAGSGVIYDTMPNTFSRRMNAKIPDYSM